MPITWKQFERYWYIFALCVTVASLPYSKLGLSIGQMMLAGGWIVERFDYRRFISRMAGRSAAEIILLALPFSLFLVFKGIFTGFIQFSKNRPALVFSSIFLLHILGLAITTDYDYAIKDLRTKFPLLLLPLIISTSAAFDRNSFYRYMLLFILAVLVRSCYNTWMIASHRFIDIRDVSHNVSHIIFSLMLVFSIYTLVFFLFKKHLFNYWRKGLFLLILGWLFIYIILSQSFTGFSIAIITLLLLIPVLVFKIRKRWMKTALVLSFLVITTALVLSLKSVVDDFYSVTPVDLSKLENTTSRGNRYEHDYYSTQTENGNLLWIYVQWDEMRGAWSKRSRIPFDSLSRKNETVAYTVVRYLTSKGMRKDGDAIDRLTQKEVTAIENGVANYLFLEKFSVRGRIYEFLWGFDNYMKTGNPTGSTVMQRFEFWKASVGIIKDNWLIGVGTGDMNLAFKAQYEKMDTKLTPDQRWRSHNQFLSVLVGFGIFGFAWFLFALFYPPVALRRSDDYFFLVFMIIVMASMLTGDTIESQTGVSFFAIFYCLLLFARKDKDEIIHKIK